MIALVSSEIAISAPNFFEFLSGMCTSRVCGFFLLVTGGREVLACLDLMGGVWGVMEYHD